MELAVKGKKMKTNSNEDINNSTEETESRRKGSDVRFLHSGESSSRLNYKAKKDGELDCLNSRTNRKQYTRDKKYSSAINSGSTIPVMKVVPKLREMKETKTQYPFRIKIL